ncbi:hypothetical protein LINPERHAP1_LOCUS12664 [Linum perenne]
MSWLAMTHDPKLIATLVEWWCLETNTFHLYHGETTITHKDMHSLTDLRVDSWLVESDVHIPTDGLTLATSVEGDMTQPDCSSIRKYSYTPPGSPVQGRTLGPYKKRIEPREGHLQDPKPRYEIRYRLRPPPTGRKAQEEEMPLQAMLLAECGNPRAEDKPRPDPDLISKDHEDEEHSRDPLEAFLEYRSKRAQEYLAKKGWLPETDPAPSPEENWSTWFQGITHGPTLAHESYVWSYLRRCPKLGEEAPSGNEEVPKPAPPRALDR